MGSYIERWDERLRRIKKVKGLEAGVYRTEPEVVRKTPGIQMRFIVVGDEEYRGLPKGVYVETNLTFEGFQSNPFLRLAIMTHVHEVLREQQFPLPNLDALESEATISTNGIVCNTTFTSSNGCVILKIEPALPSDVERIHSNERPTFPRPSLN